MTNIPDVRFSQAKDVDALGRMLDDFYVRAQNPADELLNEALWPQLARKSDTRIRFGTFVTARSNGTVSIASSSAVSTSATGIVVKVMGSERVYWTTDAIIKIPVLGTVSTGLQEIFLTALGQATLTKPTTGIIQRVGFSLFYDVSTDKHLCRIMLGPVLAIDLGS